MDGVGNLPMSGDLPREGELRGAWMDAAGKVGREAAGNDQPDAATGALGVKSRQSRKAIGRLFQPGMHRAHQHPVFQRGKTEVERSKEVRVAVGHATVSRR